MSVGKVLVLDQPRAVVAGKQNVRLLLDTVLANRIQNSTDVEVDLFDYVAVQTSFALAFELR